MSKRFAPPPRPGGKPTAAPNGAPPPQPRIAAAAPVRVPPPPVRATAAQRFVSFGDRGGADGARKPPPGDELVALANDSFGARNAARGLITRPDGTYNFVRTQGVRRMDQRTLISAKAGHAQLSQGRPVIYAGTVRFNGGALDWWSNYSGHYQPMAAFRSQAQFPDDKFVPWQKLQLGGTAMQRGLFRDRRPVAGPEAPEKPSRPTAAARPEKPASAAGSAASGASPARPEKPAAASGGAPAAASPAAKKGN